MASSTFIIIKNYYSGDLLAFIASNRDTIQSLYETRSNIRLLIWITQREKFPIWSKLLWVHSSHISCLVYLTCAFTLIHRSRFKISEQLTHSLVVLSVSFEDLLGDKVVLDPFLLMALPGPRRVFSRVRKEETVAENSTSCICKVFIKETGRRLRCPLHYCSNTQIIAWRYPDYKVHLYNI